MNVSDKFFSENFMSCAREIIIETGELILRMWSIIG